MHAWSRNQINLVSTLYGNGDVFKPPPHAAVIVSTHSFAEESFTPRRGHGEHGEDGEHGEGKERKKTSFQKLAHSEY
jgi:hypothetical protein